MKKKRKKKKRFVLGTGQLWFSGKSPMSGFPWVSVNLSRCGAWNLNRDMIELKTYNLGAYNKVRLVVEVIK